MDIQVNFAYQDYSGDSPIIWHGSDRWTFDRGAMPGEPFAFLDGDDITGVAAMVEVQPPGKPTFFEVRRVGGVLLCQADFPDVAAMQAEQLIDEQEQNPNDYPSPGF